MVPVSYGLKITRLANGGRFASFLNRRCQAKQIALIRENSAAIAVIVIFMVGTTSLFRGLDQGGFSVEIWSASSLQWFRPFSQILSLTVKRGPSDALLMRDSGRGLSIIAHPIWLRARFRKQKIEREPRESSPREIKR